MTATTHLGLPLLAAAQAQKHVTHNEALLALDALVQLAVKNTTLAAPPGSPAEGDRHIVAASPTGAWTGHAGHVAAFLSGGWAFVTPRRGFVALDEADNRLLIFDGSAWLDLSTSLRLQNLANVGINATADTTSRLSVRSESVLFSNIPAADGGSGDVRFTANKEAAGDTASLLFQTGWSGRAELGLAGDNTFRVKVSADGTTWRNAIAADPATGRVDLLADGLHVGTNQISMSSGLIGINVAAPAACLHIVHAYGAADILSIERNSTDASGANMRMRKSRGTNASPTAVQLNDNLASLSASGWDGSSFLQAGNFRFAVDTTVSTGVMAARWELLLRDAAGVNVVTTSVDSARTLTQLGAIKAGGPIQPASYTVAGVPAAASFPGAIIDVSNESGGRTLAMSDGTNWRRVHDRAVIS